MRPPSRAASALVLLLVGVLVGPASPVSAGTDFYDTGGLDASGARGSVIRVEPMVAQVLPGVPIAAKAWRILYRSTNATGAPVVVSGIVLVPEKPWKGTGPRPLVGYAMGTPGMKDSCAPSRKVATGTAYEASLLASALNRGWALAITDYPGLGTPGGHQYVVGKALGPAVLDAMRAARDLPAAGLARHAPMAIYGYSEGGEAAGWALQLQPTYAPDLDVRGGAVGAAPADFEREATFIDKGAFAFLLGYVSMGFVAAYPELAPDLERVLTPQGRAFLKALDQTCVEDAIVVSQLWSHDSRTYLKVPPLGLPALRARLVENNLGGVAPAVPVILGANRFDEVMVYNTSGPGLRDQWCRRGTPVRFVSSPLGDHIGGVFGFFPVAATFLSERLAGTPYRRPADCPV
ncbi:MAG: inactive lipase [Marmoricola sp.]|nr:inactive lipase [Marmoricola sp.]